MKSKIRQSRFKRMPNTIKTLTKLPIFNRSCQNLPYLVTLPASEIADGQKCVHKMTSIKASFYQPIAIV